LPGLKPSNSADSRPRRPAGDAPKVGELERIGPNGREVLILGVDAPGFEALPLERRIFAYYLYRAAVAGNDILCAQNHRHALDVKRLLEALFCHSRDLNGGIKAALHEYLKLVWIHHGNYNHATHTKFVPRALTREGLREAVRSALRCGAPAAVSAREPLERTAARLERTIFDPEFEPIQTNQSAGADIVATSAVNFWDPGIKEKDIDSLPEAYRHRLNVRFARKDAEIVPQIYRIGGLFGEELAAVSHFLQLALPLSEGENQRRAIERLLDFYRSGDEDHFRQHSIYWLKSNPVVDFVNGFIEQYLDPRGIIGNFEANVNFQAGEIVPRRIAEHAAYFEERMPWPDRFKRRAPSAPVAEVVNVLVETGDSGPISPAAYNLPNYNDIRRDHGSKNVILLNIENTQSRALFESTVAEFYLPDYRRRVLEFYIEKTRPLHVYLHEIIGHGSGQPDPDLDTDPRTALGRVYAALEECRADLVALYHMSDPKLVEIGAMSAAEQRDIVDTAYVTQLQGWLMRYDQVIGMEVREAHNKADQLILMYLVEGGGDHAKDFGVEVVEVGGKIYVRTRDHSRIRDGVGELLAKLQVMKSTGDYAGAASLFDRFGSRVNPLWHTNIVTRLHALGVPKLKAFVFPRLEPVTERERIVDVRIHHDEDLTAQQLRFSRLRLDTSISADC
jgi:dipeptidyl-peptidase-3